MARNPAATWLGEQADTDYVMARYDVLCIHTIVGYAPAHAAHFSTRATGELFQSRDTKYQSAANYNGNHRVIAVENEDHGPQFGTWNTSDGHAVPPFTSEQCETLARLCVWAHRTHAIPLVLCPDSKPGSRGIGYHRQGIDGDWSGYDYAGRVAGGEVWTKYAGKVCPGDRRIWQVINVIIPRARVLAGLATEDDMYDEGDRRKLDALCNAVLGTWNPNDNKDGWSPLPGSVAADVDELKARPVSVPVELDYDELAKALLRNMGQAA